MFEVWHHFFGRNNFLENKNIEKTFTDTGISAYPFRPNRLEGPGILFFDEISQELYDFLLEVSRNGRERVLAIASSYTILVAGKGLNIIQAGASDVFALDHKIDMVGKVAERFKRWNDVDQLVESHLVHDNLVGRSPAWISVLRQIVEVSRFTNAPVLITGESGTGKELVARLIHTLDIRPEKRELIILDCTTIVQDLSASEFFGHERGSFTGAVSSREGAFALANDGTLFLDEVGELPLTLQTALLRVVQEHTY